ncbi:PTTG1IP family member 2 [Candoia aspera]|uniref:PTTG1IP family member 2 n=1 Tax=Candoia aspera TaxID=51853 RepID=UPI002FD7DE9C
MAGIMTAPCWRRLWTLALSCVLLCGCPTMGLESPVSPSPTPAPTCSDFTKKSCEECIKNTTCLWCSENSTCMDYPVSRLVPPSSLCSLTKSYWAICWVSLEAIIIAIGVVASIFLLVIICCCCYCCRRCRQRPGRRVSEEEERFIRDQEEKRMQSLQRRHERKVKYDEIRKKYGLLQDSDHPYSRYENE